MDKARARLMVSDAAHSLMPRAPQDSLHPPQQHGSNLWWGLEATLNVTLNAIACLRVSRMEEVR